MSQILAILADTLAFGFRFSSETVKQDGRPFPAEIVVVEDVPKFETAFPGVILKACNGQSVRVGSQAISRVAHGSLKQDALRERNVRWLLGIEDASPKMVYVGPEGKTFETQELAEAAWMEFAGQTA